LLGLRASREWHRLPVAEAHHDVGPVPRPANQRRKLGSQAGDFDGLVDERVLEAEGGHLQRKALARTSRTHPMIGISLL